jgi:tetratricopeptide (TPR) repeat protein
MGHPHKTRGDKGKGWRWALAVAVACLWLGGAGPAWAQDGELERLHWERQIAYVRSLIAQEPSLPQHYLRLAQAYGKLGRTQDVQRSAQEFVRRGGSPMAADLVIGDHLHQGGRLDEALSHYVSVLDASPRQAHAMTQAWFVIQRLRAEGRGLPSGSRDLIGRLNNAGFFLAEDPPTKNEDGARSRIAEGNQRLNRGDLPGALSSFKDAAYDDPWNPDIYRGLGITYARSADYDRAVGAYQLYLALTPPDAPDAPKVRQIILDYYQRGP